MGVDAPGAAMPRPTSPVALVAHTVDVALVVVGAVVVVAAGGPALGAVIGAGVWILNRIVAQLDRRWADSRRTPRQQVTIGLFERFGRIWLLAAGIIVAGLAGGRPDGLTAALFVFGAYSVAFVITLFSGPPAEGAES